VIAYVLIACVAIPLVMLIIDVCTPTRGEAAASGVHDDVRPHVTAATVDRRDAHRTEIAPEPAPRAPRIAPGDGMVYRPAQRSARPR
jgi:hypothetical protein